MRAFVRYHWRNERGTSDWLKHDIVSKCAVLHGDLRDVEWRRRWRARSCYISAPGRDPVLLGQTELFETNVLGTRSTSLRPPRKRCRAGPPGIRGDSVS